MSVFIGEKGKRIELAERKDATNPNLLLNSRDFSTNWIVQNAEVTSDSYNGGKVVSIHTGGDNSNNVRQYLKMTSQMHTWSVYAKADNNGDHLHTELFGGGGRTDQALTTDWNRYTFQGISDPTGITLYFWGTSGNKGDIQIALPKLEIGNTATPWCPALEDYAWTSDIANLQNQIQADKTDVTNLQSMITGLSTKVDSATTKLQGQITEIQSKNYIEGYNCANESDAETYSKAHPNTLVTVS